MLRGTALSVLLRVAGNYNNLPRRREARLTSLSEVPKKAGHRHTISAGGCGCGCGCAEESKAEQSREQQIPTLNQQVSMSWPPGQLGGVVAASGDPPASSLAILARNDAFSAWETAQQGFASRKTRHTRRELSQLDPTTTKSGTSRRVRRVALAYCSSPG